MKCERCGKDHDGLYGSGRFCSRSCANARVFSEQTNQLKSEKQKKYLADHPEALEKLRLQSSVPRSKERIQRARQKLIARYQERPFEKLGVNKKKLVILEEQKGRCALCNIDQEWNNKYLAFELDHIDGNRSNNARENLRLICPNCHSQTDTYKTKNAEKKVTDEEMLEALQSSSSIYTAMQKLGLNPHGTHYQRAYKLLDS